MQTFEVIFTQNDAQLRVFVDIDDELIESLAKAKVPHDEIHSKFYSNAHCRIKHVPNLGSYDLS